MPTKPKIVEEKLDVAKTLNRVREAIGGEYAQLAPLALNPGRQRDGTTVTYDRALERLKEIGSVVFRHDTFTNAFLNQLVNRIARVLISSRLYRDPWAFFKRGYLEIGETVEEIFVNISQAHQFNPERAEDTVFKREIPDVRAAFHTMNYQKFYKVTISRAELRAAFTTFEGLNALIGKILETLASAANFDEFLMMRYLITRTALDGGMGVKTIPNTSLETANQTAAVLRELALDVENMDTAYNAAGVWNYSDMSSQRLILSNKFLATVDVGALAVAYNMDKANFLSKVINVRNFTFTPAELNRLANLIYDNPAATVFTSEELTALESVHGVLVDKDWFMIFDNDDYMGAIQNPEGQYFNYDYHVWKTFSTSPYSTAILLTSSTVTVDAVTVTPATATASKGQTVNFIAKVTGASFVSQNVAWSVNSEFSSIGANGALIVSGNETATTLTVTATSLSDPSKSGTATVTIS